MRINPLVTMVEVLHHCSQTEYGGAGVLCPMNFAKLDLRDTMTDDSLPDGYAWHCTKCLQLGCQARCLGMQCSA